MLDLNIRYRTNDENILVRNDENIFFSSHSPGPDDQGGHRQLIFWYAFLPDSSKIDPTKIKTTLLSLYFFYCPLTQHVSSQLWVPQKWFTYRYLQNWLNGTLGWGTQVRYKQALTLHWNVWRGASFHRLFWQKVWLFPLIDEVHPKNFRDFMKRPFPTNLWPFSYYLANSD